jgi:hypothetical protein
LACTSNKRAATTLKNDKNKLQKQILPVFGNRSTRAAITRRECLDKSQPALEWTDVPGSLVDLSSNRGHGNLIPCCIHLLLESSFDYQIQTKPEVWAQVQFTSERVLLKCESGLWIVADRWLRWLQGDGEVCAVICSSRHHPGAWP